MFQVQNSHPHTDPNFFSQHLQSPVITYIKFGGGLTDNTCMPYSFTEVYTSNMDSNRDEGLYLSDPKSRQFGNFSILSTKSAA